jgi:hypothetical protein
VFNPFVSPVEHLGEIEPVLLLEDLEMQVREDDRIPNEASSVAAAPAAGNPRARQDEAAIREVTDERAAPIAANKAR